MSSLPRTAFDGACAKTELNQYWYSDRTRHALVREVSDHATRCAFLSTPSLFFALRDVADEDARSSKSDDEHKDSSDTQPQQGHESRLQALWRASYLFEYDTQWSTHARVVQYNYRAPEQIPVQHIGAFDYVVADPPFITEDVWTAYVTTAKLLLCGNNSNDGSGGGGAVVAARAGGCGGGGGGKVLFTSVLENHTMLERLMNEALFIANYWPAVCGLTYQYVCFTNYEPTQLRARNDELPAPSSEDELRLLASMAMANELRSAEKGFALQLANRDRAGEVALPTHNANKSNKPWHNDNSSSSNVVGDIGHNAVTTTTAATAAAAAHDGSVTHAAVDWQRVALTQMPWGHIPAHLLPYVNNTNDKDSTHVQQHEENVCYACAYALRTRLDTFKSGIDALQKLLTRELQLRQQLVKLRKSMSSNDKDTTTTTTAMSDKVDGAGDANEARAQLLHELSAAKEARMQQLASLADVATHIVADEEQLARLRTAAATTTTAAADDDACACADDSNKAADMCAYAAVMQDCLAAYRDVELRKAALQELAADATRKYKSPLFHRMQELLQLMKQLKKQSAATATAAAVAAATTTATVQQHDDDDGAHS